MLFFRALPPVMFALFLLPPGALGQAYYPGWPSSRIEAFEVSPVHHWVPGAVLRFSVFGLPEGQGKITIAGAARSLHLQETDAGHYQGDYTLAADDHITQTSLVTVTLRTILGVASVQLEDTLASSDGDLRRLPRDRPLPLLGHVQIIPASAPATGSRLKFLLDGAPEGAASITIGGLKPTILLSEIYDSGHYFGTYTLRKYDAVTAFSVVSVALRVAGQVNRLGLGQYFQKVTAPMPLLGEGQAPDSHAVAQDADSTP